MISKAIKKYGEEIAKLKQKKEPHRKTLKDYLQETSFTFDSEDENLLISKMNPKLMIRVIREESRDCISFGYNYPHKLERVEVYFRDAIPECEKLFTDQSTHKITFVKGPGAKWETFGQRLVEIIFIYYKDKYPVQAKEGRN